MIPAEGSLPMKSLLFILLAVAVCFSAYATPDPRTGVWTAEFQDNGTLQMTIFQGDNSDRGRRGMGRGMNNLMGFDEPLASFTGLSRGDVTSAAANTQFELRRAAGTIAFDGRFANGTGAGHYRFTPSAPFVRDMEALGYSGFSDAQLLMFAAHGFSPQTIRDLRSLGYQPTQHEVEEIAIFRITADVVREYVRLGYDKLALRELVNFRVGRIDAAYISGMRELGYPNIPARQLADMAILQVTPAFVRDLRSAGLTNLSTRQLTHLKVGRITAEKIDAYKKLGYSNLTLHELGDFGIQGVTPKFIEELRTLGYKDIPARQLIEMRIFGVTPDYIRKIGALGYSKVPVEKLIKLKMSGADDVLLKAKK